METRRRRLGHRKSRNGCAQCKARHVKCDELRPCNNCVRHQVPCSLLSHPYVNRALTSTVDGLHPGTKHPQGAQNAESTQSTAGIDPSRQTTDGLDTLSSVEWLQSLRLWHHYNTETCHILARSSQSEQLWKRAMPEAAHSHAFLMKGMLAIAALHYAHAHPPHRDEYTMISMEYQTRAIQHFATSLEHINNDNWSAYFLLASAVFTLSLCSIAQSGSTGTVITCSDVAQSLSLLRGIKGILEYKPVEKWPAENSELEVLFQDPQPTPGMRVRTAFSARLEAITPLLDTLPHSLEVMNHRSVCLLALDSLGTTHQVCGSVALCDAKIWRWPYTLPSSFVDMIAEGQSVALIILAHFAALVRSYEHSTWVSKGWGINVMAMVERTLDPKWQHWVDWPKRSLQGGIDVDLMDS